MSQDTIQLTPRQYKALDSALKIIERRIACGGGMVDAAIDPDLCEAHTLLMQAAITPFTNPSNQPLMKRLSDNFKDTPLDPVPKSKPDLSPLFIKGVRIGGVGAAGDMELAANLGDMCLNHGVSYAKALALKYPNGSVVMLQTKRDQLSAEVYLTRAAYRVFMENIAGLML